LDPIVLAKLTQLYMTVTLECPFYDVSKTLFFYLTPNMMQKS